MIEHRTELETCTGTDNLKDTCHSESFFPPSVLGHIYSRGNNNNLSSSLSSQIALTHPTANSIPVPGKVQQVSSHRLGNLDPCPFVQ